MTATGPESLTTHLGARRLEIETPEHVAVGYELADLGSRFAALVIDGLVLAGVFLVIGVGGAFLVSWLGSLPVPAGPWGLAALVLAAFAIPYGYFVYFEGLRDGQTPGKRRMGIRAVHAGGYPLTVRGAVIRNLLRLVDMQPAGSWAVGGLSMLLHSRTRRLGDMAADSLVVRERTLDAFPEERAMAAGARAGRPSDDDAVAGALPLSDDEFEVLARYMERRDDLSPEARRGVAGRLAEEIASGAVRSRAGTSADDRLRALHAAEAARRAASGSAGPGGTGQATALVRRRSERWDEYRRLVERAQSDGLEDLGEEGVSRFAADYRATAADLARARTYGASAELIYTLERLVGAGHNLLYRAGGRSLQRLWLWLSGGFPALVRKRWRVVALAAAVLFLPAVVSFAVVDHEPSRARAVLSASMIARAEEAPRREAAGRGYVDVPDPYMPLMASGVIANNVQVTFAAFAGGILAGLGTLAILLFNGVTLGSVAGLFSAHGAGMQLWSFVLPHGVVELTAIAIAGGAGLWMGSALVLPGRLSRRDALAERGREAVSLLAGTVLLLVLAGVVEGFVSPSPLPRAAKLAFAALTALVLALYLATAGRGDEAQREAAGIGALGGSDGRHASAGRPI